VSRKRKRAQAETAPEPAPAAASRLRLGAGAAGLAAGAAALALYVATLAPSLVEGDNAELVVAVHTLGVPHPTGYPLLVLVGKLLESLLPLGSVALRVNLVGALFGAGAAGVLAWAAARTSGRAWVGLVAGLLVACGRGLWGQSVSFEVYSLNALLVALVVAALAGWEASRSRRAAYLVALAAGLALTHHRTAVFFAFPAWALCLGMMRKQGAGFAVRMALAAAAPLALYLALFPLSWRHPPLDWGAVGAGWGNWWDHVRGGQYLAEAWARPLPEAGRLALGHWRGLVGQLTWAGPALALVGLAGLRRRPIGALGALGFALTLAWAYRYRVSDALVFAVPAEMMLAWWLALGLGAAAGYLGRLRARWAAVLPALAVAALAANALLANWAAVDKRGNWWTYRNQALMLESLPRGALYLTDGDTAAGAMLYLQAVEGRRPDVAALSTPRAMFAYYLPSIQDPLLRRAVARVLGGRPGVPGARIYWFQQQLTRELMAGRGERPLCASLVPRGRAPQYAWKDDGLVQEVLERWPDLEVATSPAAGSPAPLALLEARPSRPVVRPGELFAIAYRWRVGRELGRRVQMKAKLVNMQAAGEPTSFGRRFPLAYGRVPLPANGAGRGYEQVEPEMVPLGAQPGRYLLLVVVEGGTRDEQWLLPGVVEVRR